MSRMFQISEPDLASLEHLLPQLMESQPTTMTNRQKTQWRQVQQILMDVRWNYGPHIESYTVPAGGDDALGTGAQ